MKASALSLTIIGLGQAQDAQLEQSTDARSLSNSEKYECNVTADQLSPWEATLDTCNLENQHLSFRACTKINTGKKHQEYQSSAHSYAYYVKQFFTFKTCYHGSNWKKLYFWEQHGDEVCKVETEHTLSIADYFYATKNCVHGYCSECFNQCEGEGRKLEGNDDNADDFYGVGNDDGNNYSSRENGHDWSSVSMNCDVCETGCSSYAALIGNVTANNGNYDPPHCTLVSDQSGTSYYYGPRCMENGHVSMSFYFDDECELHVKKDITIDESQSPISSSFDLFAFVDGICHDCATGVCESVYESAYHCTADNGTYVTEGAYIMNEYAGGYNKNSQDEQDLDAGEELCVKTHKLKDIVYYHNHSSRVQAEKRAWEVIGFIALGIVLVGASAFGFVSYTYYVRHCVDWGDSNLMCWTDGCGGCGGDTGDADDDDDGVLPDPTPPPKKKRGRRLV